jgi:hypothetical protein
VLEQVLRLAGRQGHHAVGLRRARRAGDRLARARTRASSRPSRRGATCACAACSGLLGFRSRRPARAPRGGAVAPALRRAERPWHDSACASASGCTSPGCYTTWARRSPTTATRSTRRTSSATAACAGSPREEIDDRGCRGRPLSTARPRPRKRSVTRRTPDLRRSRSGARCAGSRRCCASAEGLRPQPLPARARASSCGGRRERLVLVADTRRHAQLELWAGRPRARRAVAAARSRRAS